MKGSFRCGDCLEGFFGNQSLGCEDTPGMCPDGTRCDANADCEKLPGMSKYRCKVSTPAMPHCSCPSIFIFDCVWNV